MKQEELILAMSEYFKKDPKQVQHLIKVHSFAHIIGVEENLSNEELEILETAAIVHDIGIKEAKRLYGRSDGKLQEKLGPDEAEALLSQFNASKKLIQRVSYLVGHHHTYTDIDGMDYQILVEADFLVNIYEGQYDSALQKEIYKNIFKTTAGKKLFRNMYESE